MNCVGRSSLIFPMWAQLPYLMDSIIEKDIVCCGCGIYWPIIHHVLYLWIWPITNWKKSKSSTAHFGADTRWKGGAKKPCGCDVGSEERTGRLTRYKDCLFQTGNCLLHFGNCSDFIVFHLKLNEHSSS